MEPIFDLPPDLPAHAAAPFHPAAATTIREWPIGTFVENLAVLQDGLLAVAVHTENVVEILDRGSRLLRTVQLPVPPTGLVARQNGGFYVAGGEPGTSPGRIWRVDPDGRKELAAEVPDALFLNGLTPMSETSLFAAESLLGRIYRFDLHTGEATVWLADSALSKITSFPFLPGANGIKVYGDAVYVTNTDRATVVRIRMNGDGTAGPVEIIAEHLRGDDFAFDVDGNAYFATHIENSVMRLAGNGERTEIAGADQGMAGSTALAFGRLDSDRTRAYVTTTGGLVRPYRKQVQPAKLVALDLAIAGAALPLVI